MRQLLSAIVVAALALSQAGSATAQTVQKSYSYFAIGGRTLDEIESELGKRGPQVGTAGKRHPGATRMEFSTSITYADDGRLCWVEKAAVTVKAKIILPRWKKRGGALQDVALVWDTLSSDIKRHEESHVGIAKNHARELQQALLALPRRRGGCEAVKAEAAATANRILKKHDEEQDRFDRIEGINFESRLTRLMQYRIQQIEAGRLKP